MRKTTKILLIVAASLVAVGLIIIVAVMTANNWDWSRLDTMKYETNTHEIIENFDSISINTNTADIIFLPSDDGSCRVVCYEEEKEKHSVNVKDGNLIIEHIDTRKWYDRIVIMSFTAPKITVYLPEGEYGSLCVEASTGDVDIPENFKFESIDIEVSSGDVKCLASVAGLVKIKTSTGDICLEKISAEEIDLTVTTGKITASSITCAGEMKTAVSTGKTDLDGVSCENFSSNGTTGDISLKNVIAAKNITVLRDTGDVRFENSDAENVVVRTSTGDVKGTLLSEKIFFVHTDTGKEEVPKTMNGGMCEINTNTGDIIIKISE